MEVLVFEPQEKTWGYSSFRFGGRVQTNFDDDNNFQFMLQHTLGWLNSWGGELRTEAQIGEKVSFSMQLYQPIGTASPFYLLPGSTRIRRATTSITATTVLLPGRTKPRPRLWNLAMKSAVLELSVPAPATSR